MRVTLEQFEKDYIISWDFDAEHGTGAVSLGVLHPEGSHLVMDLLGFSSKNSGVISIRQALEAHEAEKRREEERKKDAETLRKSFAEFAHKQNKEQKHE